MALAFKFLGGGDQQLPEQTQHNLNPATIEVRRSHSSPTLTGTLSTVSFFIRGDSGCSPMIMSTATLITNIHPLIITRCSF